MRSSEREYFLSCPRLNALVTEYFDNLKPVFKEGKYSIPPNMVRCFLTQLFEVMDYAHKRGVMMRDPNKKNVMIQDGKVKMFDWNYGKVYDPAKPQQIVRDSRLNFKGPPEYQNEKKGTKEIYANSHAFDVWVVGGWIENMLKEPDRTFPGKDRWLLRNLVQTMHVHNASERPTLLWLLNHHEYFSIERNDSCILSW